MTTVDRPVEQQERLAASTLELDRGFVLATGIECSAPLVDGRRVDELVKTGHIDRYADDFRLARDLGVHYLRYGVPFHVVDAGAGTFDWAWIDRALDACRASGLTPIVDLMHFGVPDDLGDYQNPALPERFGAYVRAFVERYPWVRYYTPVNEPYITAAFSARQGFWNEQRTDETAFVGALLNVVRCSVIGATEIRRARPDAVLIGAETCHYTHPMVPDAIERADLENELRFTTFELAFGRDLPAIVVRHLLDHGVTADDLSWFGRHGSDENWLAGNDYYSTSEMMVGTDGQLRSSGVRLGYYELAHQYHDRLRVPIMHTETNSEGEAAGAWLDAQWTDILRLRREGFPIRGFTWYGLVNHVDWDSTLTVEAGRENGCGLVSLDRRPTAMYRRFAALDAAELRTRGGRAQHNGRVELTTMELAQTPSAALDSDIERLHRDGITGLQDAFPRDWVERLREDMMTAFWAAIQRPGGAVGRGPRRWYVEVHPQDITGFVELASHPWVARLCETVLGPDYEIVEIGFDVPFQGARFQPWHRDFPSPPETYEDRRITSLAFNLTGVDVTEDMGPFEIASGTLWDDGRTWKDEMFSPKEAWPRFAELGLRKFPQMGDISARSALTIHRGTEHASPIARPVLVLGVDAPGAGHAALHDMMVTPAYHASLPEEIRRHLVCRVADELVPVVQKHDIEGLVMGAEE